jgi:hypothetical protein
MLNGIEAPSSCLAATKTQIFQPQAEDILTDEDLLDLFRIVKQVLRKKPDSERLSKLLFCMSYALGDHVKFCKPLHEDCIIFRDDSAVPMVYAVKLPSSSSCCDAGSAYPDSSSQRNTSSLGPLSTHEDTLARSEKDSIQKWIESSSAASPHSPDSSLTRLPSVSYLTHGHPNASLPDIITVTDTNHHHEESTPTNPFSVRPYTNFRPLYNNNNNSTNLNTSSALSGTQSIPSPTSTATNSTRQGALVTPNDKNSNNGNINVGLESNSPDMVDRYAINSIVQPTSLPNAHNPPTVVMEPQQRGFYYQDGRIAREPVLLQRYAEQGILTQASLMRKRKRHSVDANSSFEMSNLPVQTKKPKIPHRHGEFESRRKYLT